MIEIWKDVLGFEGAYQVSNTGKIKSLKRTYIRKNGSKDTKHEKILSNLDNGSGYKYINLGASCRKAIHVIVAESFLCNPENKKTVNHINGNKSDNRLENLEWATHSENHKHAYNTGLRKAYERSGTKNPNYRHGKRCALKEETRAMSYSNNVV